MDYGGKLAPKSKADYAFLLHGFYHLKQTGTMAIVLPHGVLFRGAAEGTIRQILLENGAIYAVIGLPANMFYNTSIPTCIIVLKKHREGRDVLFIDASKLYEKKKKQNVMQEKHIDHVLELYCNRVSVDKEAYLASFEDIQANDYNLNQMIETMKQKSIVSLRFWSKFSSIIHKSLILLKPLYRRPICRIRRIHCYCIKLCFFICRPVSIKGISVAQVLIFWKNTMQKHIHTC